MVNLTDSDSVAAFCRCVFISQGYRPQKFAFRECLLSFFSFHNESMNIWSHFIGCACMIGAAISITTEYLTQESQESFMEFIVFQVFVICAILCLFLSVLYHWFGCLSLECHDMLLQLDLTGVGLLIAGSFVPGIYYGFKCTPEAQVLHLGLNAVILMVGLWAPWITAEFYGRKLRPFVLASLVVVGLVPFTHWLIITPAQIIEALVDGFLWMFFWYALGFIVFICKVPERFFPNSFFFTQIAASHAIWHCCILAAVYVWFHFIYRYRSLSNELGCSLHSTCAYSWFSSTCQA